ncbi:Ig-like domain-containing protein [Arthrobacter sp. V1I7]|uniref:Ig-like domain-containing protein n=2 Tax=unclassified Arthrobacter TaxID=235627 RepID=UPI0027D8CFEC|nr:Ig-like domain-containing protein [Arthrobacter sp. V1I7]
MPVPALMVAAITPTVTYRSDDPAASHERQLLPSNSSWDPARASPMSYDAQLTGDYTFNVRAADAAGNVGAPATFAWRIGDPDTVVPTLTAQSAAANATVTGVNGTSFVLQDANGAVVPAAATYDTVARRATLDPTDPLASNTRYTASLKNTATDPSGNATPAPRGLQHGGYRRSGRDNADTRGGRNGRSRRHEYHGHVQ